MKKTVLYRYVLHVSAHYMTYVNHSISSVTQIFGITVVHLHISTRPVARMQNFTGILRLHVLPDLIAIWSYGKTSEKMSQYYAFFRSKQTEKYAEGDNLDDSCHVRDEISRIRSRPIITSLRTFGLITEKYRNVS